MSIYFFSEEILQGADAGNKARNDVEQIWRRHYLPLYPYLEEKKRKNKVLVLYTIIKTLLKTKIKDYIFIQYPLPKGYSKLLPFISKCRNCVILIHDLSELRSGNLSGNEMKRFRHLKYIISHNEKMTEFLVAKNIKRNIVFNLELFDYLSDKCELEEVKKHTGTICFAGNLIKSKFLYNMPEEVLVLGVNLYGNNFKVDEPNSKLLNYKGVFDSEIIHTVIDGQYGLIWDGESCKSCAGDWGNYMRYNNPHKLSMYIAAGIPVIVWEEAAIASFVQKENIGICIKSIEDIKMIANTIVEDDYDEMRKNVLKIRENVMKGYFLESKLKKIEEKIYGAK